MKKILFWSVVALVAVFTTSAVAGSLNGPMKAEVFATGDEPVNDVFVVPPSGGLITQSPGIVIGETQYDYQSNGSTGNRVAVDNLGGRHFVWMKGDPYPSTRSVYFNYCDPSDDWPLPEGGQPVSQANGAGYTQITLTSDDRAAVAYHETALNCVTYAEDQVSGYGIFEYYDPPDFMGDTLYWPYVALDSHDRVHIVSVKQVPEGETIHPMGYTMSEDRDDWSRLLPVDTTSTLSQSVVASPVSDKVAIIYAHPMVLTPAVGAQLENNIYYIQSEDGLTWDWTNGKINVTEYSDRDSLRAYTDLAAIYDYNDNLHIVWNAQFVYVIDGAYYVSWRKFLYHYSTGTGAITEVTHTDTVWVDAGCDPGGWNLNIAKMSLGVQEATNNIYTVYTGFLDTLDCSAGGFANGELYMCYSVDGGLSWSAPENLTNSPSPGCIPGECDSDHWSSLADRVEDDNSLHIIYTNDKDAGGIPQDEGSATDNPVMYLEVTMTGVDEDQSVPISFALSQNYPNPFNARTNIEFELLENSRVDLSVYDITGAKVATLVNGEMEAGVHSINWDADKVASGVYYYSLKANDEQSSRKMTLLK